jgi:hypothetical protein
VRGVDELLCIRSIHPRQLHFQIGGDTISAFGTRTDADGRCYLSFGRNAELELRPSNLRAPMKQAE